MPKEKIMEKIAEECFTCVHWSNPDMCANCNVAKITNLKNQLQLEVKKNAVLRSALRELYSSVWQYIEGDMESKEIDIERRKAECQ